MSEWAFKVESLFALFILNQFMSSCSLVAWCNSLRLHADKIIWGTIKTSPQEDCSGMSRFKRVVQAQDLHRWFSKPSVPYFYLLLLVLALSCLLTPVWLAQVQNLPCSSGGTRCFTLHRGWRTDLPTSMLSGCAFFSVSSNSSKISLEQRGKTSSET